MLQELHGWLLKLKLARLVREVVFLKEERTKIAKSIAALESEMALTARERGRHTAIQMARYSYLVGRYEALHSQLLRAKEDLRALEAKLGKS